LNEINGLTGNNRDKQEYSENKRPSTVLKRTSIETADFFHNNQQDPIFKSGDNNFICSNNFGRGHTTEHVSSRQHPEFIPGMSA
jgi:hypothetical protein